MLRSLLSGPGKIEMTTSDNPVPLKGEVLIRLRMVGICGSDVHLFKNGPPTDGPLTTGHEGIGVITATGKGVPEGRVGERVVIEPNIPCARCPECRRGRGNICRNKRKIGVSEDGCFAEYVTVPGGFAHTLPDAIADIDAVAIEPAVVAFSAIKRARIMPGDTIAVIGLGAIGMLLTHTALSFGYRVLVSEVVESKIRMAEKMGAEIVHLDVASADQGASLEKKYEEAGVAAVFECAGSGKSATLAIQAAPRGADVIVLGLSEGPASFSPRTISQKGNSIIPSLIYDHPADFQRTIALVEKGIIQPGFVVTRSYPLAALEEALKEAQKGEETKIVVRVSEQ
ncbi:MAG: zinc-dependent alcohol dehydrogenase [Bacteroidales bacterium]